MKKMMRVKLTFLLILPILIASCEEKEKTHVPKPVGYMRTDLPEHFYEPIDSNCQYLFNKSTLAAIETPKPQNACNKNLVYKKFNAKLHLTYVSIDSNKTLYKLIEDSRNFAYGHQVKASAIKTKMVYNPKAQVSGLEYEITGDAASPIQFYVTDSTNHFLRGAVYFSTTPNYDSLKPYIDFIQEDVKELIGSVRWQNK